MRDTSIHPALLPALPAIGGPGILLVGIAVWLLLVIRAIRRPDRRHLPLRLFLLTAATAALTLAGLRPARTEPVAPQTAVLLTARADRSVVDSLRRSIKPEFVFSLETSGRGRRAANAIPVPDLAALLRNYPGISTLHLVGDGLSPGELDQLGDRSVTVHLNRPPEGVIALQYPYHVPEGAMITLGGVFLQHSAAPRSLRLDGPAGAELLLENSGPGVHRFRADVPARTAGRFLLTLTELDDPKNVLRCDTLPLVVAPAPLPRILIINQAPIFETRHLKNWLADRGYPIAVRSAVSRGRDLTEFSNRPAVSLRPLSRQLLADTDILLLTGDALAVLTGTERNAVREAVRQGLGLGLLAGEELPELPAVDRAFFLDFPRRSGGPSFRLPGLETDLARAPYVLLDDAAVVPLVTSQTRQAVAAVRRRGRGRLTLSLMQATYPLLLEGNVDLYETLWTDLLEHTARPTDAEVALDLSDPLLLFPDHPLELTVRTAAEITPPWSILDPDSSRVTVAPAQHPLLTDQWTGVFRPRRSGWHRVDPGQASDHGAWFYVQPATAWPSLRLARQLEANRVWAARHPSGAAMPLPDALTREQRFPLWWFYIAFLLAAGGLWLEERW